ncbi:S8 family serine peptidase [candidate division KSB1 bacterium]|nr:S8 family serine peptidase [candidate division KSB1 bacterium]MBL7093592.1 S8 family serine peptidase [candidate division KSB1 bacterium]
MKKLILLILTLSFVTVGFSSNGEKKLDAHLKMVMNERIQKHVSSKKRNLLKKAASEKLLNVFIKGDALTIKAEVENAGGFVNTVTENIVTAQVPRDAIMGIAESNTVMRIKLATPVKRRNNEAVKHVGADKVHAGVSPLNSPYTGENVIVGIIDSGIDWEHEDFRDPQDNTKSRVLYIWDQNDSQGNKPADFSYSSEWTRTQIEDEIDGTSAGIVRHKDDLEEAGGHGTHVSGTAAGNNGLAPGSDIIVVCLDFESSTGVVDGANYIYQKAAELGRPAVINASLGSHYGPHDGSGAESLALDQLINAAPGRAFCAAAGNEGGDFIHYGGFELGQQESWTYYYGYPFEGDTEAYIDLYMIVDNTDLDKLFLAVGMDSTGFNEFIEPESPVNVAMTNWKTINEIINNPVYESITYRNGEEAGSLMIETSSINANKTEVLIMIEDFIKDANNFTGLDLWRLYTKGSGKFHVWSEMVMSIPQPSMIGLNVDSKYRGTDNAYTVGMSGDAKGVITVGASTNRATWMDVNGTTQSPQESHVTVGSLADFSSKGPTLDNRIKPEIVAPGHYVASALSSSNTPEDNTVVLMGGKHIVYSGTSMSSPVVTGAVALLLEKNPNFTNAQIRSQLFDYTLVDNLVQADGSLPNNLWGYGKLDIFSAMTGQETGVEITNPTVASTIELKQNYPNPFNPETTIGYNLPEPADVKLIIYDLKGREVRTLVNNAHSAGNHLVKWNSTNNSGNKVAAGVYLYQVEIKSSGNTADSFISVKKLILMK